MTDPLERDACVAFNRLTVDADDGSGMNLFADSLVIFDLTVLGNGGSAVDKEVKVLVGGDTDGQGVGTEHTLNAEGGSDGGTGVCTGHTDAAFLASHAGIVAGNTVVAGIADNDHAHAVFLGLVDSHSHRLVSDDLTHTVMTVNDGGGGGLFDDLKVGYGVLDTCFDAVKVDGFEAVYTVGLNAALVAFKQNIRAYFRVLTRDAVANKAVYDEICDCTPINDVVFCHDFITFQ